MDYLRSFCEYIMGRSRLPHPIYVLTPDEAEFNARMSRVRIAVEQVFGLVLNTWAYNG
ncbi:hypothetical protein V1515DRAFT_599795 [Lipomyces mesembrius]